MSATKRSQRALARWGASTAAVAVATYGVLGYAGYRASLHPRVAEAMSHLTATSPDSTRRSDLLVSGALLSTVLVKAWVEGARQLRKDPTSGDARALGAFYVHAALWACALAVAIVVLRQAVRSDAMSMSLWAVASLCVPVANAWYVWGIGRALMSRLVQPAALLYHMHVAALFSGFCACLVVFAYLL